MLALGVDFCFFLCGIVDFLRFIIAHDFFVVYYSIFRTQGQPASMLYLGPMEKLHTLEVLLQLKARGMRV